MLDKLLSKQIIANPEYKWNISGAFYHDEILWRLIDLFKGLGIEKIISSVHGSPGVFWDSKYPFTEEPLSKPRINFICNKWNNLGIPIYFTFSRKIMKTSDFHNKAGNWLLAKASEYKDWGVILSNDDFAKHVRDKYPKLAQVCSIRRSYQFKGLRDKNYYQNLASNYDRVVIHASDNFNLSLLNSLEPKDKFEILASEQCVVNCPCLRLHERWIDIREKMLKGPNDYFDCPQNTILSLHAGEKNFARNRKSILTSREIERIYHLGFKNFKLMGRGCPTNIFLLDLCSYLLVDEWPPIIFKFLSKTKVVQ